MGVGTKAMGDSERNDSIQVGKLCTSHLKPPDPPPRALAG